MVYFDNAATTMVDNEVLNAMIPYLSTEFGNPSSLYSVGWNAHKAIEKSRDKFAGAFNCKSNEIFFTGGGSEGDNWILKSFAFAFYFKLEMKSHIITSKIEHSAILETCKWLENNGIAEVTYVGVNKDGIVNIEEIENSITDKPTLISIMYVNNEVGTIQPIKKIGEICNKYENVFFHTDATQAIGHIKVDVRECNIDFLTCSAHKFYGPKGIGVAYIKDELLLEPLIHGGHQEQSMRAGTENVAGIVGAGVAIEKVTRNLIPENDTISVISNYIRNRLQNEIEGIKFNNSVENSIYNILNITFDDIDGEIMQLELGERGICVSVGSACNSGIKNPSHVLTAMGIEKEKALNSIRISIGRFNCISDAMELVDGIKEICNKIRK